MKGLICLIAVSAIAPQSAFAIEETIQFDTSKIKSIKVNNGAGDLQVGVTSGPTTVTFVKPGSDDHCVTSAELVDSVLIIESGSKAPDLNYHPCFTQIRVKGPKNVALRINNGSSNIEINDTAGSIEYQNGSGNIRINAEITELQGRAGSGNLWAVGLIGNADIRSGSGEIALRFDQCPDHGRVNLRTGSGNATIGLPHYSTVLAEFWAGSGELINEFPPSADPKIRISMRTGSGNLLIRRN